ncbi:hypothetical protein ANO11243_093140 [Dothideomycetidae sp. 11243]|nr:hypothetical protein ANO11243_093140 [fungal sp. No.11243]
MYSTATTTIYSGVSTITDAATSHATATATTRMGQTISQGPGPAQSSAAHSGSLNRRAPHPTWLCKTVVCDTFVQLSTEYTVTLPSSTIHVHPVPAGTSDASTTTTVPGVAASTTIATTTSTVHPDFLRTTISGTAYVLVPASSTDFCMRGLASSTAVHSARGSGSDEIP